MIPQPTLDEQRMLIRGLAPARLRRFRSAVGGADRAAVELYLLDAQIASYLHGAVRFVEIALREHVHRALTDAFGSRWFETHRELFDAEVLQRLDEALARVGRRVPAGKLVAQLTLGTWVALLGRGDRRPDGTRTSYTKTIWDPSLQAAFPGRSRREVHRLALRLNWARNRINHCEPVVFGFPQPGLGQSGVQVRRSPRRLIEDARELLGCFDGDLARWMHRWTEIDALLNDPRASIALDHIDADPRVELQR